MRGRSHKSALQGGFTSTAKVVDKTADMYARIYIHTYFSYGVRAQTSVNIWLGDDILSLPPLGGWEGFIVSPGIRECADRVPGYTYGSSVVVVLLQQPT